MLIGRVKNIICKKAVENFLSNSVLLSSAYARESEGKIAVERETAIAFTIIPDRLFANEKTAMLPETTQVLSTELSPTAAFA